jgi:GAF domain-containing protein
MCVETVQIVQSGLGVLNTTLFLYSKRGLLISVARAGVVPDGAEHESYSPAEDLVGACAADAEGERFGSTIVSTTPLIATSTRFRRLFERLLTPDTQLTYLPLTGPNRTYGVIRCISEPNAWLSPDDLTDLKVFAHQVAISISSLRRKVELDVLERVNDLLTDQPENVARVYDQVTKALVDDSTEFAACSIRIRDRRGDLVLESLNGDTGTTMMHKDRESRRPETGLAHEAFATHAPIFVTNVQDHLDQFHDPFWIRENDFVTAAVFPIFLADENIGVLALYLRYPYDFYDTKIAFLQKLCHQVATATRVVGLLMARQQLIERMNAIVSHSTSADELLQTILDSACDLTGASQGYISLISKQDARLKPRVQTATLSAVDIPPVNIDGPKGLTALAVRTKKSVRCGDVRNDPLLSSIYIDFDGDAANITRSELVVPLVYVQHVLGVIAVQSPHTESFTAPDTLLLETLAQYATLIFQRDRLYDATNTLANVDFSRVDRQKVLSVIARSAAELVDADAAIVRTLSKSAGELRFESYFPENMAVKDVAPLMPSGVGACWDALRLRDVVIFKDLAANPNFHNHKFIIANGFSEMVSVPLLLQGNETRAQMDLGVINIFFRTPSPFLDLERRLLRALGVSASYAIHDVSIIEDANRASALAAITARTTKAVELSISLGRRALTPLQGARSAAESIERAIRRVDITGVPTPLEKLQTHLKALEAVVTELAPATRASLTAHRPEDIDLLSDAFRLIHTKLFSATDKPRLNIGEPELWRQIGSALRRVTELLELPSGAAFLSTPRDYSDIRLVAATPDSTAALPTLRLQTFDDFAWLAQHTHVILPRNDGHFAWLNARTLIGTARAILYGHEVTGGKLLIIALGLDEKRALSFEDLAMLYEAIVVQIFTYIDNAMFGIELDFLTGETGHLMGRAIGKVESGTRSLLRSTLPGHSSSPETIANAQNAVESGLIRLKLIRTNFYWFSAQRRNLELAASVGSDDEIAAAMLFDVAGMLRDMRHLFSREALERDMEATRFMMKVESAIVRGPEDLLQLAFLNLFDNALKFAYAKTFIDISLRREGDICVVVFENLGVGVAPDEQKAVFKRLRRSRFQDRSRRIEGLGLGLSYCRRVIHEIFHGKITLTSRPAFTRKPRQFEGDNWLTTVTVTLPLAERVVVHD